jgi:hypothetical protein
MATTGLPVRQLRVQALILAQQNGDPRPVKVEVVRSRLQLAEDALALAPGSAPGARDPETPVWVVQATGDFTCADCPAENGSPLRRPIATWVINVGDGTVRSTGYADKAEHLRKLGRVVDIT